jgi:hypothetical protein
MTANKPVVPDSMENQPKFAPKEQRTVSRQPITCDALQSVITKAVRDSGTQCEAFVGVLLQQTAPKSRGDVNWALKGIKYGKGDRTQCDVAISDIVEQLQREFIISDEPK